MKKLLQLLRVAFIFILIILSISVWAQENEMVIGDVSYRGSGCPQDSIRPIIKYENENSTIDFLFYDYYLDNSQRRLNRGQCTIAIPVSVPDQFKLVVKGLTFDFIQALAADSSLQVALELFFSGDQGVKINQQYLGPLISIESLTAGDSITSGCGSDVIVRLNSSFVLKSKDSDDYSGVMAESQKINLSLESCQ